MASCERLFRRVWLPPLIAVIALSAFASNLYAWSGKVVGISDGDTISVLHAGRAEKVRLHGIDCPEKRQAFGNVARRFTADLVAGKIVEVDPVDTDRYGRTVAWVWVGEKNVNLEIVRHGFAWHYKKYSSDLNLSRAEQEARRSKIGLWKDPHPLPPWKFRHPG